MRFRDDLVLFRVGLGWASGWCRLFGRASIAELVGRLSHGTLLLCFAMHCKVAGYRHTWKG